jgi:hypothetical protein
MCIRDSITAALSATTITIWTRKRLNANHELVAMRSKSTWLVLTQVDTRAVIARPPAMIKYTPPKKRLKRTALIGATAVRAVAIDLLLVKIV